jgi:GT2 family glycosyltransferase
MEVIMIKSNIDEYDPIVFVSILNWNGWQDTIECLESLQQLKNQNIRVVVLDNASTDNSVEEIISWLEKQNHIGEVSFVRYNISEVNKGGNIVGETNLSVKSAKLKIVFIKSELNLGFAGGNNVIINYALNKNATYVWVLNNDTVVLPNSLDNMINILQDRSDLYGITPQIRYFNAKEVIWNCGGMLNWYGTKKYIYSDIHYSKLPKACTKEITFVTGCAVLIRGDVFSKIGLLSDRYFFGTEDLEYSQRIKEDGGKLAVAFESVIYHKVNRSSNLNPLVSMVYNHYLGIFINMRLRINIHIWQLWRFAYCAYILYLLLDKFNHSIKTSIKFFRLLLEQSSSLDRIDRDTFEKIKVYFE